MLLYVRQMFDSSIKIGSNNNIESSVIIHRNVKIGNNNKIYGNTIIHPNTEIGDNNIIYPGNVIGELPCSSYNINHDYDFSNPLLKGVKIGDNNVLYHENWIQSGLRCKTLIGNNNILYGSVKIGHDVVIKNHTNVYAESIFGGNSILMDNSTVGMRAAIIQNVVIGNYSMIGLNNTITKNVFPFFVNINNEIKRINTKKTSEDIVKYEQILRDINELFSSKKYDISGYDIPEDIRKILIDYAIHIQNFENMV